MTALEQPILWCQQKECGEFARWLTVLTVLDMKVDMVVCDDHREDVIGRLADGLYEIGVDAGIPEIRGNIKQYDLWVSDAR